MIKPLLISLSPLHTALMTFSLMILLLINLSESRRNRKSVLNHQLFEVCCRHLSKTTIHESSQGHFPLLSSHSLKQSVTTVFVQCISIQQLYKVSGRLDFWLSCYIGPSVFLIADFLLLTTVIDKLSGEQFYRFTNEYHCNSSQTDLIKETKWNASKYLTAASNEEREQIQKVNHNGHRFQVWPPITLFIFSHCLLIPSFFLLEQALTSPTHSIKLPSILPPTQKTLLYRMHTLAGRQSKPISR